MRRKTSPTTPVVPTAPPATGGMVVTLRRNSTRDLLRRLGHGVPRLLPPGPEGAPVLGTGESPPAPSVKDQLNTAIGCKTSEVALTLLSQVVKLEHLVTKTTSEEHIDTLLQNASAMLAELQPTRATEALLAAQMVGAQRPAMEFLVRATLEGQTVVGADANVLRATRLMRIFNEQVETMAKLKGKGGQQRVVAEHVTVAAGGQAIVGTVIPGGGGRVATIQDEPHERRRGRLKNGNPPGDWRTARRCGAWTRRRTACQCPALRNRRRCRLHGGKSTGPKTAAGLEQSRRARWKHGRIRER